MPYVKTALAAEALRQRSGGVLAQRQRTALILFDGKRSVDDVLRQTAGLGVQREDITHLLDNGLLHDDGTKPAKSASAPPDQPSSEKPSQNASSASRTPSALTVDEQQRRYRIAYPLATQLTATLGLRGFKLNLAVEKADGYAGLRELLPKIEAAAGADRTAELRSALDGLAPASHNAE